MGEWGAVGCWRLVCVGRFVVSPSTVVNLTIKSLIVHPFYACRKTKTKTEEEKKAGKESWEERETPTEY